MDTFAALSYMVSIFKSNTVYYNNDTLFLSKSNITLVLCFSISKNLYLGTWTCQKSASTDANASVNYNRSIKFDNSPYTRKQV